MTKVVIYKPTQNRKTQEIIKSIIDNKNSINIVFTDNLCMLGSQTANRIVNQVDGAIDELEDKKTISVHCESIDVAGVSRKEIHNHIYGLIVGEKQIRNIITLTNSIRLPQIKSLIEQLIRPNPLFGFPIVPNCLETINLYFDEADKHIMTIIDDLGDIIDDNEFIKDFYITATPKRILKVYNNMILYPVENNLDNYIPLQHANWIEIENEGYLPSIKHMLDDIKENNYGIIPSEKFIFSPGINLKDSHFEIGRDATCNYNIVSVIVNSSGLTIMLSLNIPNQYLTISHANGNGREMMIPSFPGEFINSLNKRKMGNGFKKTEDGYTYYEMVFDKKQLIYDNENEFWRIMKVIRHYWSDLPILVTGSRCVERGITIQDPNDNNMHFTDGVLHSDISKSDSGSQMAGRFTLTYNSDKTITDFVPINIYSSVKTKNYMINQEKKAMYAVNLSSSGQRNINYNQWRNYERRSVLGLEDFKTFKDAIEYAYNNFSCRVNYTESDNAYDETKVRLGSCNMIKDGNDLYMNFRYNSFDMSGERDKRPISIEEFKIRCTRHLNWRESGTGNPWRIWSVYDDLTDNTTLKYYLCWTPVAEIGQDGDESDSDSDL